MPTAPHVANKADTRANYAAWRSAAADALEAAGLKEDADSFRSCGDESAFRHVDVCEADLDHAPRIIPYTCKKRYCQECEHREQARKLLRYIPAIWDAYADAPDSYTVKKFELTTPFCLTDPDAAEKLTLAWSWVKEAIQRVFFKVLYAKLSPQEKRRGRIDLRTHKIFIIASQEFGENGKKIHFHLTAVCPYIPKSLLTDVWKEVSAGECEITWIKKVDADTVEDTVVETVKYCTKFSTLPPDLVPVLATVLQGQHRVRLYGLAKSLPKVVREAATCRICEAKRKRLTVTHYIAKVEQEGKLLDDNIMRAYEKRFGAARLLDLKHGNCSGETPSTGPPPPNPPGSESPPQPVQTGLNLPGDAPSGRKFRYWDYQ